MTHFKKYLSHRLRSTAFRTLVITLIATVLACAVVGIALSRSFAEKTQSSICGTVSPRNISTDIEVLIGVMTVLATLYPILETYHLKSTKTLDVVFSLPVTRTDIARAHYICGFISLVFSSAVVTIAIGVELLAFGLFNGLMPLLMIYLWLVLFGAILYSIVIFLFSKGNTAIDGAVSAFLFIPSLSLVAKALDSFIRENEYIYKTISVGDSLPVKNLSFFFKINNVADEAVSFYDKIICKKSDITWYDVGAACDEIFSAYGNDARYLYVLLIWILCALAATAAFVFSFEKYRAEHAGDISDSFFCYRSIIPMAGFSLLCDSSSLVTSTVIVISMLIGYFICRRSFRIKPEDIYTVALGAVLMLFV